MPLSIYFEHIRTDMTGTFYFKILLVIYSVSAIEGHEENIHFGHRIKTDMTGKESPFYVFEMTPMNDIMNCVVSCKLKKQCNAINYDHLASLCCHVGKIHSTLIVEDSIEKKSGFSYADKREWDMVRIFVVNTYKPTQVVKQLLNKNFVNEIICFRKILVKKNFSRSNQSSSFLWFCCFNFEIFLLLPFKLLSLETHRRR